MSAEAKDSRPAERKFYTPQPLQNRVIERHLEGASNRAIATAEGLDRETVNRILSQKELVEMRAEQQSRLQRLGFKAIAVYEQALDSQDLGMALMTGTKILEGIGVLDKRGLQGTINDCITRQEVHQTIPPAEFAQGRYEFKRRKPRKMSVKTELQVVPDQAVDDKSGRQAFPADESGPRLKN